MENVFSIHKKYENNEFYNFVNNTIDFWSHEEKLETLKGLILTFTKEPECALEILNELLSLAEDDALENGYCPECGEKCDVYSKGTYDNYTTEISCPKCGWYKKDI